MHRTISRLSQSNKQLEEEKSSLVTALKLIQDDINNFHTENRTSGNKIEGPVKIIERDSNSNAWIKPKHKQQSRPPTTLLRIQINLILAIALKYLIAQNQMQVLKQELENQKQNRSKTDKGENLLYPVKKRLPSKRRALQSNLIISLIIYQVNVVINTVDVAIFGDSMIKFIDPSELGESLKRNVIVKTFSRANVHDMKHYIKPTIEKKNNYRH